MTKHSHPNHRRDSRADPVTGELPPGVPLKPAPHKLNAEQQQVLAAQAEADEAAAKTVADEAASAVTAAGETQAEETTSE